MTGNRVLLTGATGFIGKGLVASLAASGYRIRVATRTMTALPDEIESAVVGDLRRPVNLTEALRDVDFIVHSAGLAHANDQVPEETFREVNAGITGTLAAAARQAGIKRFVLLSSVRAQVGSHSDEIVTEAQTPQPTDAYGRSKLEAELLLADADIPFVVLRPVLVHGPGMRFNMAALMELARSPWPLPLGAFRTKHSIVARDHLAEAVTLSLAKEEMADNVFLVADPDPLSVGEMATAFRQGWNRGPGILPLPTGLVGAFARLTGRGERAERLQRGLTVDPGKLLAAGWRPQKSAFEALVETARAAG